ncbi:MAG: glycosyltransferase [Paludibacteraceae bacterium]|nr:glycosyltransferase [Paludibacteraceae bacterium]
MRVLFINTNDTSGGAARAAMRIMRGVQQCGVEAQMFVKDRYSKSSDVIPVSHFAPPSNFLLDIFKWIIQKFKNRYHMFKWHPYKHTKQNVFMSDLRHTNIHGALQKLDYDIVHLHWINNRFLDIREMAKIHKPIVWTLHDSWPFCGVCHYFIDCNRYQNHCGTCPMLGSKKEQDLAYEIFENKLAAYRDLDFHIVTPSRWLGDCAKKSALLGRFPVHVIPNCLDTELFCPLSKTEIQTIAERQQNAVVSRVLREATEKRLEKPLILFGAMNAANDRRKGFSSLLSALQLLDKQGFTAHLVVFGANAQELPMHFRNIDVTFVGYIGDSQLLTALYNIADVMVVPSLTENLSNAIMESLSCGTPVVAFNIGGNSDMIDHQQNGYLATELDCEDMAYGIQWCIKNNTNDVLSMKARQKVMNNFTIDIVSKQYKQLYQSLL